MGFKQASANHYYQGWSSELVDRGVTNPYYFFLSLFLFSFVFISGLYDLFLQIASETRKFITRAHQNHTQRMDQVAVGEADSPPIFILKALP